MDDEQLLGDLVISLETAERQATERGHSLRDEARMRTAAPPHVCLILLERSLCRHTLSHLPHALRARAIVQVLMVHGVLHLLGYDHEEGPEEHDEMAAAETKLLTRLGWSGEGLIAVASAA